MALPTTLSYFWYPAETTHSSYTTDSDSTARISDSVHRSCSLSNGWYRCPVAVLFSGETLAAFSTLSVDFETTFLSALRLDSNFSTGPFVCWRSDICLAWIHFLIFPIVWHCTLVAAYDRHPAYEIVSRMVSVLLIERTNSFIAMRSARNEKKVQKKRQKRMFKATDRYCCMQSLCSSKFTIYRRCHFCNDIFLLEIFCVECRIAPQL